MGHTPPEISDGMLYDLHSSPWRTGETIEAAYREGIHAARLAATPEAVAVQLRRVIEMLRFYEIDGIVPHPSFPVQHTATLDAEGNLAEAGAPDARCLLQILARAEELASDWPNSPDHQGEMARLRSSLRPHEYLLIGHWVSSRSGLPFTMVSRSLQGYAVGSVGVLLTWITVAYLSPLLSLWLRQPSVDITHGHVTGLLSFQSCLAPIAAAATGAAGLFAGKYLTARRRIAAWETGRRRRWQEWLRAHESSGVDTSPPASEAQPLQYRVGS